MNPSGFYVDPKRIQIIKKQKQIEQTNQITTMKYPILHFGV